MKRIRKQRLSWIQQELRSQGSQPPHPPPQVWRDSWIQSHSQDLLTWNRSCWTHKLVGMLPRLFCWIAGPVCGLGKWEAHRPPSWGSPTLAWILPPGTYQIFMVKGWVRSPPGFGRRRKSSPQQRPTFGKRPHWSLICPGDGISDSRPLFLPFLISGGGWETLVKLTGAIKIWDSFIIL